MTGKPDFFCLMCDTAVTDSFSVNIYTTVSQHNGEPLVNLAAQVLRPSTLEFHSVYLCLHCYKLFRMLEEAQYTVANIRCEILKVYGRNRKEKAVKRKPQSKEHDFVDNFSGQDKAATTHTRMNDTVHEARNTLRPISSIIIASQAFSQDTMLNQDLSIQSIDTIMENDTTKVMKNISVRSKEIGCLDKKDIPPTVIKDPSPFEDDQAERQNFLDAYKACINFVDAKANAKSSPGTHCFIRNIKEYLLFFTSFIRYLIYIIFNFL